MAMVRFDDFNVGIVAHHLRRLLQQFQHDVYPHAKVCRKDNRNLGGRILNGLLTGLVKTGGANHHPFTVLTAKRQVSQRAFRAGKIDKHVKVFFHRLKAALHGNARLTCARQLACIGSQKR